MSSRTWEEGDSSTKPIRGYGAEGSGNNQRPRRAPQYLHISLVYICAFVIVGVTSIYLYFVPKLIIQRIRPYYPIVNITRGNVSGFSLHDDTFITGTWRFELILDNPNKWTTIHYYLITTTFGTYHEKKEVYSAFLDQTHTKLIDQEKYTLLHLHVPIFLAASPINQFDNYNINKSTKGLEEEMSRGEFTSFVVDLEITCLFRTWLVEQLSTIRVRCFTVFNFNSTTKSGQMTKGNCTAPFVGTPNKLYRTKETS